METIIFQKKILDGVSCAVPFSKKDQDKWNSYRDNQVTKHNVYGVQKQRSYEQLRMFFAACDIVAQNTEDPMLNTKEKVAFAIKVRLDFINPNRIAVTNNGDIIFEYRSISYDNLNHIEACDFFNRAFKELANMIGIANDELLNNT